MTVKLEVGKKYCMRNGKKCLIVDKHENERNNPFVSYIYPDWELTCYGEKGNYRGFGEEHGYDIISEWTEPTDSYRDFIKQQHEYMKTHTQPPTETLRDEFAIAATQAIGWSGARNSFKINNKKLPTIEELSKYIATMSYIVADAMMKQREIKE